MIKTAMDKITQHVAYKRLVTERQLLQFSVIPGFPGSFLLL
jgi:hypothetical protein